MAEMNVFISEPEGDIARGNVFSAMIALAGVELKLKAAVHADIVNNVAAKKFVDWINYCGFEQTVFTGPKTGNFLLAGDHLALVTVPGVISGAIETPQIVAALHDHFSRLWTAEYKPEILLDQILPYSTQVRHDELIKVSSSFWNEPIRRLRENQDELYRLSSREFEELVQELLNRNGFDTILTPATRDGGCDIIARTKTPLGSHIYLVECKRYNPSNPVGVSIVRAMYGALKKTWADGALIVTTSHFTKAAIEFQQPISYELSLHGRLQLVSWLEAT